MGSTRDKKTVRQICHQLGLIVKVCPYTFYIMAVWAAISTFVNVFLLAVKWWWVIKTSRRKRRRWAQQLCKSGAHSRQPVATSGQSWARDQHDRTCMTAPALETTACPPARGRQILSRAGNFLDLPARTGRQLLIRKYNLCAFKNRLRD